MRSGNRISSKPALTLFACLMAIMFFTPPAQAGEDGFVVEAMVKTSGMMGQPGTEELTTMYMTPTKMKMISGDKSEVIVDAASKMMTIVSHPKKEYYVVAEQEFKQMMEMGMAMMEGMMGDAQVTVESTGETKAIGKWKCEKVVMSLSGQMAMTQEMWVTKDTDIDMNDYMAMSEMLGQAGLLKKFTDEMKKIDGYPIQTKTIMTIMGQNVESENLVQSITSKTFAASTFSAPTDYAKKEGDIMQAMQAMQSSGQ